MTRAQVARLSKFKVPIHPASLARIVWDSFTLLLLFILVIVYPFVAAFDEQLPGAPRDRGLSGLVGLAFSVDVVLNLLTGFRAKHSIKVVACMPLVCVRNTEPASCVRAVCRRTCGVRGVYRTCVRFIVVL